MQPEERYKLERTALGNLLLGLDPSDVEEALELLDGPESFKDSKNRAAYAAILKLRRSDQQHRFVDVANRCEDDGTLKTAGGFEYIGGLAAGAANKPGLLECAKKLTATHAGKSARSKPKREAILRRMSDIDPKPLRWLWPGFLPLGKLSLIGGDPGLGKSMLTLDFAARVSTGSPWPDGSQCPRGEVILLNAEDDAEDTIRPRLDAAQANPEKVHELFAVRGTNGSESMFSLEKDVALLEATLIANPDVILLVIDPISAYLGKADSYRETEIRNILSPLQALAAKYDVAIVLVTHLNKNSGASAVYRLTGSTAFVGVARAVFAIDKDPEDEDRRLFAPVKANLAIDCVGMAYKVTTTSEGIPRIGWESEPIAISAQDLLCPDPVGSKADEVEQFLREVLADGEPTPTKDIFDTGENQGFSRKRLRRAREKIGATYHKQGFGGDMYWQLTPIHSQ